MKSKLTGQIPSDVESTTPETTSVFGAQLTRRGFLKTGGVLAVGVGVLSTVGASVGATLGAVGAPAEAATNSLDPSLPGSWIEIHADNTILFRTGKCDFGQSSVYTAYRQIVADELYVPFEAITSVVIGDTDRTPDGGGTFDLLGRGVINLRKVAAYTRQAIVELASQRLGVARDAIVTRDGKVSGGGKSMTYGELVSHQDLKLTIPVRGDLTSIFGLGVEGNPPMKPASEYTVVGKPFKNSIIPEKVTARITWVTDVRLPGMLHARMVHPTTLGSRLVSAGKVDAKQFPNAQVVVKGDMVAVVAPDEWEAVQAAEQVAEATKWSDWKGLPGNAGLFEYFRQKADWKSARVNRSRTSHGDVAAALGSAAKTLSASYEMPYFKHAPIGPTMAVADYRPDGTVTVHAHSQNPQALRGELALMLGVSVDRVIVRQYAGAGHYGRSNGGNAGAEAEAVILSKELGRPVRVHWMRADDFQWSTQSPAAYSDVKVGLDANGMIAAWEIDHYMPAVQDDRPIGAVLAGLPTMPAPSDKGMFLNSTVNVTYDPWLYEAALNLEERAHGTWQVGQQESPLAIGLRDHTMRTPGQFQQNYPREAAMSEAAALAGVDAIEFRIKHTKDERAKNVLERLREESGWETRPAPHPKAAAAGETTVRGQGVSLMLRSAGYWGCACQIALTPSTGAIKVEKVTMVVDVGIVVNPLQLKRQVEGGVLMGVSQALFEEMTFDESRITARDWISYPILTMGDIPEIKVVLLNRPEVGRYGQGSESANALAAPALAAAVFDATGKPARRLPLRPAYVKELLHS